MEVANDSDSVKASGRYVTRDDGIVDLRFSVPSSPAIASQDILRQRHAHLLSSLRPAGLPVSRALEGIVGAARRRDDEMRIGEASMIERGDQSVLNDWRERRKERPCWELPDPGACVREGKRIVRLVLDDDRRRSRSLFDTLRALAEAMRPLTGLKAIVLVSEGMIGDREVTADIRRFAESARRGRRDIRGRHRWWRWPSSPPSIGCCCGRSPSDPDRLVHVERAPLGISGRSGSRPGPARDPVERDGHQPSG
jgi:hypothetical protein